MKEEEEEEEMDYFELLNLPSTGTLTSQSWDRGNQDFHALYSAQRD
jgi:hypothetical protein